MEGKQLEQLRQATGAKGATMEQLNGLARVWQERAAILEALGISARTLTNYCQAGKVERRKVGRKSVYRLVNRGNEATQPGQRGNTEATKGARGNVSGQLALALDAQEEPSPVGVADTATLARLLQQLTDDLGKAREEKGEAVAIGWTLAERLEVEAQEKAELAARLAELQKAVFGIGNSTLARPFRRRILQALQGSLH
jgi:hypothetical protein